MGDFVGKSKRNVVKFAVPFVMSTLVLGLFHLNLAGAEATVIDFTPSFQTPTMAGAGDVADDSAVFVNGDKTWIVADSKDSKLGGVYVYDNTGKQIGDRYAEGMIGNVDLRSDVMINGSLGVLVGANNRTAAKINLWALNPETGALTSVPLVNSAISSSGYGFCLGKTNNVLRAFVTRKDGYVDQFRLDPSGAGFAAVKVTSYKQTNSSEGCVFDDQTGVLYTAEDHDGVIGSPVRSLRRYDVVAGTAPTVIDTTANGRLTGDIEGLALAQKDGKRYLVVSSQETSRFGVYDVTAPEAKYVLSFHVASNGIIDDVGQTDGISIGVGNAGAHFPAGMIVVHDGTFPGKTTSNLKYVALNQLFSGIVASGTSTTAAELTTTTASSTTAPPSQNSTTTVLPTTTSTATTTTTTTATSTTTSTTARPAICKNKRRCNR